jgi:5-methyltetrahydrofolate--homocysteine methyltransferase
LGGPGRNGLEGKSTKGKIVLATVKGDVHDIGKNIVGVVLGCNSYDVVDLGVMVSADRILQTAIDERADLVGLSGLITPSLDEMVFVAQEMSRRRLRLPLLIGGATTSRQHTAVKIAPQYEQATVHVLDASRVVDVVASLLSDERRPAFERENRALQQRLREQHGARAVRPLLSYPAALANRLAIEWTREPLPVPAFTGPRVLADVPLTDIIPYIDWTFFFAAWELKGTFPAILQHDKYGQAARELYDSARQLLDRIVRERLLTANGVYGFWPAASEDDDIVVYRDGEHRGELTRFNMLRQQETLASGQPNLSLADFIMPADLSRRSGEDAKADYIGAFAVTAGLGADDLARRFEREHDDYTAILVKALADRLAEAFAAYLHHMARKDWRIDEPRTPEELLHEAHRGIRPAFGYPACPDHSEKFKLFTLLGAGDAGISLTDHAAMIPAASVSGLYFAHPQAKYFTVGRLGEDQIASYARRKGQSIEQIERWVGPNLAYEPARC